MEIAARMGLTAIVIGTATAVAGTGRVTLGLVASTTLCWSFVPVLQLLTGLLIVHGAGANRRHALARYFATDRYWSSWILSYAAALLLAPNAGAVGLFAILTAPAPLLLTARALVALRRELFADSRAAARRLVLAHQAVTIAVILVYAFWAGALWPRIAQGAGT